MKFNKYKIFSLGLLFGVLAGGFLIFSYVNAQVDTGIEPVGETLGMAATDIRVIVANIIRIALGLLGIVALVLILYGGFVWMTAGGNADKVAQAKKILVNAAIGLVIILSAYAIVSFVMNKLLQATSDYPSHCFNGTQDEGETGVDCGGECAACGGGGEIPGGENLFYVQQKPSGEACVRNFYAIVVFNRPVNLATIASNLIIRRSSDQVVAGGTWQFVSNDAQNSIKFIPNGDCGDGNSDCLDADTQYDLVFVTPEAIQSQNELTLNCNTGAGCGSTNFQTGSGIDRTAPTIVISYPEDGERIQKGLDVPVDVSFTDDNGVQNVSLYADGGFVTSQSISGCQQTGSLQLTWPTANVALGNHNLRAVAWDYSAAEDNDSVNVFVQPTHCYNEVMDEDETGVDCGGTCGACSGDTCTSNEQCASGYCEIPPGQTEGVCVDKMQITGVSPLSGAFDTYVTISGKFFGSDNGRVYFTASAGGWIEAPIVNCGSEYDNWTDAQIVVSAPRGATDGPIRVDTGTIVGKDGVSRQFTDTTNDNWGPNFIFDINDLVRPGLCMLDPTNGPPYSTTVMLSGKNFGSSQNNTLDDSVWFGGLKSLVTDWTDGLIRVKVPGLGRGPVAVTVENEGVTGNGLRFFVSEETGAGAPVIYGITPVSGARGEYVTISGDNFGNTLGKVILKRRSGSGLSLEGSFDFPAACADSVWTNNQIVFKIPTAVVLNTDYSVQVQLPSDPPLLSPIGAYFTTESGNPSPGLCKIDPVSGPIPFATGKNMSFYGEYFTSSNVTYPYFWSNSAVMSTSSLTGRIRATEFISWADQLLVVRPPTGAVSGPVVVNRSTDNKKSNPLSFTVFDCTKNNNTCTQDGYKCCTLGEDAGVCRPQTELCTGETRSTGYMWRFSTRDFPLVPHVLQNCDASTDAGQSLPSPSPSIQWNAGNNDHTNVCRSALSIVGFTAPVTQASVNNQSVHIYRCRTDAASGENGVTGNTCTYGGDDVALRADSYTLRNASSFTDNYLYLQMLPTTGVWEDNTWYQVVLDTDIRSVTVGEEGNIPLAADKPCGNGTAFCYVFRTDATECLFKQVVITPFEYWTSILESPIKYRILRNNANDPGSDLYYTANGLSDQHCIWMNTDGFTWSWNTANNNYATIYSGQNSNQAQVSAIANTVGVGLTDDIVNIMATANRGATSFTGNSPLTIDLSTPEVVDYWPNCLEACPNAQIGVRFNLAMSDRNVSSNAIRLRKCNNENCTSFSSVSTLKAVNPADRREILITPETATLEEGSLYMVTISSSSVASRVLYSMGSATDPSVLGKGYYKSFSWRFRVKNEACLLDRVEVAPSVFNAPYIDSRTVFGASAYAAPDECRPTGQRLDGMTLQWNWNSSDTQVATVRTFVTRGTSEFCTENCLLKGSEILFGEEFYEPVCGNGRLEAGEDCDTPNANNNCGLNCLQINKTNTGSDPATEATDVNASICGNGLIGAGEDCDLGVSADVRAVTSSMNCSERCLHTGSRLSAAWCQANKTNFGNFNKTDYMIACGDSISRCGDGITAPNEAAGCELSGGGYNSSTCSTACLLNDECAPFNNSGQRVEGCGLDHKFLGSSLMYKTPSLCGDNTTGLGEYPTCESTMVSNNHTLTDPWALVIGRGDGTVSGEPPSQKTTITAVGTQQSSGSQRTGSGEFIIQCGAKYDSDCAVGYGVADNSCCYPRPMPIYFYPAEYITESLHGASWNNAPHDVCPNTYIDIAYDKKIDPITVVGNVYLARGEGAETCAEGRDVTYLVAQNSDVNLPWYKKVWNKILDLAISIKNFIFGKAQAFSRPNIHSSTWCAGVDPVSVEVIYEPLAEGAQEVDTVSHIRIKLEKPLATSTEYTVILQPAIKDIRGVSIGKNGTNSEGGNTDWQFITRDEMCQVDALGIDPAEYLFDTADESTLIQVFPTTYDGYIIQPVEGYSWNYLWGPENNDYISLNTTTADLVTATTKNRNGEIDMVSKLNVLENVFSDSNPEVSTSTHLTINICENPWTFGVFGDTHELNDVKYNFSTYYCRDSGSFGVADDLPNLTYSMKNAGVAGLEAGVLRKYLLFSEDVPDAIGISVISNTEVKSVYDLLSLAGFGNYQKTKIKGFDAITDNYNVYVDAVVRGTDGTTYTNIYLFSLNQNAGPEMRSVFEQLLNNLEFNYTFADNVEYCGVRTTGNTLPNFERPCKSDLDCLNYSDTKVCLNIKDKIARNYARFKDLRNIKQDIEDYKVETGSTLYPLMAENTYLTGQAMSVWTNAWNELSNQVGVLPVDPINRLRESGTCYLNTNRACDADSDCGASSADSSLKASWKADNNTEDSKGDNEGNVVGGVTYVSGKGSGMSFEFNGDNESYVNVPHKNELEDLNNFSIALWFKPTKQAPGFLIKKGGLGDNNVSAQGFELEYSGRSFAGGGDLYNNGTIRFAAYRNADTPSYYAVDTANPLELNKWHHIVLVKKVNQYVLFIDGTKYDGQECNQERQCYTATPDILTTSVADLQIGKGINGDLDNITFYNTALTDTQVSDLRSRLCVFHDPVTGWSTEDFRFSFACNTESLTYRYVYNNTTKDYQLRAKMENDSFLAGNTLITGDSKIIYDTFGACVSSDEISSPNSLVCGDGIVGSGEQCDPPGRVVWDTSACPNGAATKRTCNNACQLITATGGHSVSGSGCRTAVGGTCGDGKIQSLAGEVCDDGDLNGQIWRCKDDCSGIENEKCGNGVLDASAGELCDPTVGKQGKRGWCIGGPYTFDPADSTTYVPCNSDSECVTSQCYITGEKYSLDSASSCSWDCKSRSSFCGDGISQGEWGEDCDGEIPCVLPDGREGSFKCLNTCRKDNTGGDPDMLALWQFDYIGPNGEVVDSVGNYDGSCKPGECPAIVEGKHVGNPAFDFMGQTRLVTINDINDKTMATPPFSYEMWFKPVVNTASNPRMVEKGGRDQGFGTSGATGRIGGPQILIYASSAGSANAQIYSRYFVSGQPTAADYLSSSITLDNWHHLISAFEPTSIYSPTGLPADHHCWYGNLLLYVDGVLRSSKANSRICDTDYPLCFGVKCNAAGNLDTTGGALAYKGSIEDIAFYNKVIDQETISEHASGDGWYCTPFEEDYYEDDPNSENYVAYCGNGIIDEDEVCDTEDQNGIPCNPAVGSRCSYCAYSCDRILFMERY